jgi:hypothetical protein
MFVVACADREPREAIVEELRAVDAYRGNTITASGALAHEGETRPMPLPPRAREMPVALTMRVPYDCPDLVLAVDWYEIAAEGGLLRERSKRYVRTIAVRRERSYSSVALYIPAGGLRDVQQVQELRLRGMSGGKSGELAYYRFRIGTVQDYPKYDDN